MPAHHTQTVLAGRYRVLRPLGSGGMATVFLCEDTRLGRQVAVKRLHAHSPEDAARRFAREAKLGASLNHPNLVTVYDTVSDDEGVLIVMEHVPGSSLRERLRQGPLAGDEAVRTLRDLAAGLDHAHAHGVTHRDVKPANVLLRDDGVAKLVDLGIAVAADQTRITRSGTVLGTASYMAPEQLEGGETGPAADVYALAAVAYEMLSGTRARSGRTAVEIAHQVASEPPPDVRDAWPEAPGPLALALKRGMAPDPLRRLASAGELAKEIEDGLRADRTQATRRLPRAPQPSPRERAPSTTHASPPSRRRARAGRRWLAPAALLAVALIAAILVGVLLAGGDGSGDPQRAASPEGGERGRQSERDGQAAGGQTPPAESSGEQGGGGQPGGEQSGGQEADSEQAGGGQEAEPPAQEQPAEPPADEGGYAVPEPAGGDPARAAELNDQGYRLLQSGRFEEAVPLLEEAVRLAPAGTVDPYGYALFNLGSALRQAGRAQDAVRVLERRLAIPDQLDTVRAELELARAGETG